jgi:AcrR family transcriptional regulator
MNNVMKPSKYKDIFKTGKELFWNYGIKRVTIEEICGEAGVSKMTFYKFFPNKMEFAKTILEVEVEESLKKFEQVIHGDISFTEKVKQMFILKLEGAKGISIEFISDIYKNPEMGLQQVIEKQKQKSLGLFVDFLTDSQKKGLIRKDIKIDFILYYLNQMLQMFDDKQLVSKYDYPHDLIMEAVNFLFYGLLSQK